MGGALISEFVMLKHVISLFFILFALLPGFATGQSLDSLRQMALNGKYQEARELCRQRNDYPSNPEVAVFEAQTYFWEKNFQKAKNDLITVLEETPGNVDAISTLTSVFIAMGDFQNAIDYASSGLKTSPENKDLLYNRSYALAEKGYIKEARIDLNQLLRLDPNNEKALELKKSLQNFKVPGAIKVTQSFQNFDLPSLGQFFLTTIETPVAAQKVKLLPRFSCGTLKIRNTTSTGSQAGLDVYTITSPSAYFLINYAYSESDLFPTHHGAIEWFTTFSKGWDISAGVRYLYYEDHQFFITSAISRRIQSWEPAIRVFYSSKSANNLIAMVSVRRYLKHSNNFIHFFIVYGSNPDRPEKQIDFMYNPKAQKFSTGAKALFKIGGPFYGNLKGEFIMQEYAPGNWHQTYLGMMGLEYRF